MYYYEYWWIAASAISLILLVVIQIVREKTAERKIHEHAQKVRRMVREVMPKETLEMHIARRRVESKSFREAEKRFKEQNVPIDQVFKELRKTNRELRECLKEMAERNK